MKSHKTFWSITAVLVLTLIPGWGIRRAWSDELQAPSAQAPLQAAGQGQMTTQEGWYLVRAVDANDATLTDPNKTWDEINTSLKVLPAWNTVTISFLCYGDGAGAGDPNEGSFQYELYVCRQFSSLEWVCSGTATVGELRASHLPYLAAGGTLSAPNEDYKWAEGSANLVTSEGWTTQVNETTTANDLGKISFDPLGTPYIYIRVFAKTKMSRVYVLGTGR